MLNKVYKKDKSKKFHPFKTVLEFRTIYGARNGVGIGLWYRPAKLHSLAELVPKSRFLGFLKVLQLCAGILEHSMEARSRVGIGVVLAAWIHRLAGRFHNGFLAPVDCSKIPFPAQLPQLAATWQSL